MPRFSTHYSSRADSSFDEANYLDYERLKHLIRFEVTPPNGIRWRGSIRGRSATSFSTPESPPSLANQAFTHVQPPSPPNDDEAGGEIDNNDNNNNISKQQRQNKWRAELFIFNFREEVSRVDAIYKSRFIELNSQLYFISAAVKKRNQVCLFGWLVGWLSVCV